MPVISTNTAANTALRYLNNNSTAQSESLAKLSSGSRIVSAKDDASGLAIATSMNADVTVLNQAATNVTSGTSVLNTADGALSNIADILQRMKSLTAQAQSGSSSSDDISYIDAEYQQLLEEVDDITTSTTFNGITLLDGTSDYYSADGVTGGVDFLVGTSSSDVITVKLGDADTTALSLNSTSITSTSASGLMDKIDDAITDISKMRADVGATLSRFEFRGDVISTSLENLESAASAITDVDIASEQTNFTNAQTLTSAAISALSQANSMSQSLLKLLQ
ncbi:flagellin [Caulobacter sp. D4A]|uniref:flagellin n=1 Tax=unclassified Caulobacter TaxID=2648921 RepID=UPI000D72835A|nr:MULTISPECIES: flagellin [unclassified Caulobacter]PXA82562.1 flagellin [Caulobacter sp. D4A]PXA93619.1 flagellin [Caulobacter sp. D5]